jgi:NAD(P)-dependent dehydrogenase (short-subunit alcohol dehydrogenase family)
VLNNHNHRQSKLANIVYAAELARRYSTTDIKFISVHPGPVKTTLATSVSLWHSLFLSIYFWFAGVSMMEISQGRLSQLWAAAGAKRKDLVNGGFYMPVGRLSNDRLDTTAKSLRLATDLWNYTQDVLARVT